jgi:hypothetical protein
VRGQGGTAWEAFDPATPALSVVEGSASMVGDQRPVSSGVSFWHPSHELFGFGVLVGLTATALYLVNERGSHIGGHANLGPASVEAEAGIGKD